MTVKEVVMNREEFASYLSERLEEPSDIGRMIRFIDNAFLLQNDVGRPAYVFEVSREISREDVEYVQEAMRSLGVCACIVPSGIIRYEATLTPESMGDSNIKTVLYGRKAGEDGR